MIITMHAPTAEQVSRVLDKLQRFGLTGHVVQGQQKIIITAEGDGQMEPAGFERLPGVDRVIAVTTPYKLVSREFHAEGSIIEVSGVTFGGTKVPVIAGPCAIESFDQVYETAVAVKDAGASMLRAGAFKPRTSPYSFQGLEQEGLEILLAIKRETGLPVVSEVMDPRLVESFCGVVDMLQIGARNMQNYALLREVADERIKTFTGYR